MRSGTLEDFKRWLAIPSWHFDRRMISDLVSEVERLQVENDDLKEFLNVDKAYENRKKAQLSERYRKALEEIYLLTLNPNKPCRGDIALIARQALESDVQVSQRNGS